MKRMRLSLLSLLALALAPLSAGCASSDKSAEAPAAVEEGDEPGALARFLGRENEIPNAGPCPLLGVLYDASRKVEFVGGGERFANVAYTGELNGVRGLCRYIGGNPIEMSVEIDMAFGKGPAATRDSKVYRYWVAVTRANLAPIQKQYFEVKVDFPRGQDRVAGTEKIERIVIPRANEGVSGANFEILVGFDLTPQELAFNREGKRFRVDVGQGGGG